MALRHTPTVVFAGKRGVGKSSTLNAVYDLQLKTDPAVECTLEPSVHTIIDGARRYRVVDMPGIAANLDSAAKFRKFYVHWLRRADVLVWITQADNRAYRKDQEFFHANSRLLRSDARVVIAISKFDTLISTCEESESEVSSRVSRKIEDIRSTVGPYAGKLSGRISFQPYSIAHNWNVRQLGNIVLPFAATNNTDNGR